LSFLCLIANHAITILVLVHSKESNQKTRGKAGGDVTSSLLNCKKRSFVRH